MNPPTSSVSALVGIALAVLAPACSSAPTEPEASAERWPAADRLFEGDSRWVGGDGAYSLDLQDGRTLWLFGDSFIAHVPYDRDDVAFINNSAAIELGSDPTADSITFYWGAGDDGGPRSLVESSQPGTFLWPMHAARLADDALLVFFEIIRSTDSGELLGFDTLTSTAFIVRDFSGPPSTWDFEELDVPDVGECTLGEAALVEPPWLYIFANETSSLWSRLMLARTPIAEARAGNLNGLQWWNGSGWADGGAVPVVPQSAPELSVHFHAASGRYVMVHGVGALASLLAVRVADRPEGPWSDPRAVFRPEESFEHGAFVYAGKASPALSGDTIVATYVETDDYLPRFVRIQLR